MTHSFPINFIYFDININKGIPKKLKFKQFAASNKNHSCLHIGFMATSIQVGTDQKDVSLDEKAHLVEIKQVPKFYNTEEYWTLWIGLCWYIGTILITLWKVPIAHITVWNGVNIVNSLRPGNIAGIALMGCFTIVTLMVVHHCVCKGLSFPEYVVVIVIVVLCKIIGNYEPLHDIGFGDSIWCIIIGMIYRNTIGKLIQINKCMLSLDFFIKVSIVLLAINLQQVAVAGAKGLVVAWLETLVLIVIVYYIGIKLLKISPEQSIITTVGLGVCGTSAVLSIKDAIKISADEVTSLITMMSVLTIVLIPTLPMAVSQFNLNNETAGAWIGGCVDSIGAVSASSSLLGQSVLHFAIIIKMLQNIVIGPIALVVTVIWSNTFNGWILWEKFPKFVFGFVIVSIITTVLPISMRENVVDNSFILSEWFASIAFVLIGIDVDVLVLYDRIKTYYGMLFLYLIGQTMDIGTTLGVSYIMFTVIGSHNETDSI